LLVQNCAGDFFGHFTLQESLQLRQWRLVPADSGDSDDSNDSDALVVRDPSGIAEEPEQLIASVCSGAQPYENFRCALVDILHLLDLMPTFCVVLPINANGVDPKVGQVLPEFALEEVFEE
jgi:hypothetical protein